MGDINQADCNVCPQNSWKSSSAGSMETDCTRESTLHDTVMLILSKTKEIKCDEFQLDILLEKDVSFSVLIIAVFF